MFGARLQLALDSKAQCPMIENIPSTKHSDLTLCSRLVKLVLYSSISTAMSLESSITIVLCGQTELTKYKTPAVLAALTVL